MDFISDKDLQSELSRCQSCLDRPCERACPVGCSPTDFIRAARGGAQSDMDRAAGMIRAQNPMGYTCGRICAERHCMKACSLNKVNRPLRIPDIQAAILRRAKDVSFAPVPESGYKAAVVGGGPAGLSAAAVLRQRGCAVTVFERESRMGGACRLIPEERLGADALDADVAFIRGLGVTFENGISADAPETLLDRFDGVIWAAGRYEANGGGIAGAAYAQSAPGYLAAQTPYKRVAILGGGAIAADCALQALRLGGAPSIFALETLSELPLGEAERQFLFNSPVELHLRCGVKAVRKEGAGFALDVYPAALQAGEAFRPSAMYALDEGYTLCGFDAVVLAMGAHARDAKKDRRIVWAGECADGPERAVEAVASGKAAAAALLEEFADVESAKRARLGGYEALPVSLACTVFGYPLRNPFLLSASPVSDGYERVKRAYEAGWAGAVLKTAFHDIPVRTPAEYMYCADELSFANCDSVSARTLDMLCADVARLRAEFPDRLTMASTGTEMTGDAAEDKRRWQYNTKRLEQAGAMGIEYSLSCPGTDGMDALAVNQDVEATLRVVRDVLEGGDPRVVKLFKLTASVPSVGPFVKGIKRVLADFPEARAAVTLGDTLPNLIFQDRGKTAWEDGVIMGMGGRRIFPINAFALVKALHRGLPVVASGGVTSYRDAANALAMGVECVQFCSLPMRYGFEVIRELESGVSHLMQARGITSLDALRGAAGPEVVLPFEQITEQKRIPQVDAALCAHCKNCSCCPAQAVSFAADGLPVFDPERCIGCSFCTQICFSGALRMGERQVGSPA